jgi:protocatechuate 4,5-dioxygenase beta chain
MKGKPGVAKDFLSYALKSHFDLGVTQELRLDHSVLVPLHFLTPSMDIPVVPLYVNGLVPPLPSAERCFALGQALGQFIEELDGGLRVALIASGAFSLEVGGPKVGYTDEEWVSTVAGLLGEGKYGSLAKRATAEQMYAAGNVSGELLCWITVVGALGDKRPLFVETDGGSGYAAWNLE